MTDNKALELKQTSSYPALLVALGNAATPLPIRILEMSHAGRVMRDGISDGTAELIGYTLGLPQRIARFYNEHAEGRRDPTPTKDQKWSQEWFGEKLKQGYELNLRLMGKSREVRDGLGDDVTYGVSKMAPLVGSFFVPGLQGMSAVKVPRLVSSIGSQLGLVEVGMDGYDWTEDKFAFGAGAPAPTKVAKEGTSGEFDKAATHQGVGKTAPTTKHPATAPQGPAPM